MNSSLNDLILIRPASESDSKFIKMIALQNQLFQGLNPDEFPTNAILDEPEKLQHNGGAFDVLVTSSGDLLGFVALSPLTPDRCELIKLHLRHDQQSQGLGRLLLKHALLRAQLLGFSRVELTADSRMEKASLLARAHGFFELLQTEQKDQTKRFFAKKLG